MNRKFHLIIIEYEIVNTFWVLFFSPTGVLIRIKRTEKILVNWTSKICLMVVQTLEVLVDLQTNFNPRSSGLYRSKFKLFKFNLNICLTDILIQYISTVSG